MFHRCTTRAQALLSVALVPSVLALTGCALKPDSLAGRNRAGKPPAPPRLISPEIHPDRSVTFRLRAPKARTVTLSGEFLHASTNLVRGQDGIWSLTVGPVEPEIYYYNLNIDGVRTIDPGNADVKTGADGRFAVTGVPAGRFSVSSSNNSAVVTPLTVTRMCGPSARMATSFHSAGRNEPATEAGESTEL